MYVNIFKNLFLEHVKFPQNFRINNLKDLSKIMKAFQSTTPYNNLNILDGSWGIETFDKITKKVLIEKTGGFCYQLNSVLNHFMKVNGMNVKLVKAFKSDKNLHENLRFHFLNILNYNGKVCIVDVAAGSASPLQPVVIDCQSEKDIVIGLNGNQCRSIKHTHGTFLYQTKSPNDREWKTIYHFNLRPVIGLDEFHHAQFYGGVKHSYFNQRPLVNILTADKSLKVSSIFTLTDSSFTKTKKENQKTKKKIENNQMFNSYLQNQFNYGKSFEIKQSYHDSLNKPI
ncbi:hypothetical protein CYY_001009 [Polysphondylium violaceum]|uniref:Arylamine N-acetyltransferase n=1 Tax=Polysphondylium violaceum TaxID=133409 RepID=A0A8J4Q0I6_9MYCE|nr:hypothetical protein CYY_001009 [Polysphondylium violaceum]